jgi:cysteine desulfurase
VAEYARLLSREGFSHFPASVDRRGGLDVDAVREALAPDTALVSVMAANNEYGGVFPITQISAIARNAGAVMHSDAVSALGRVPIDVGTLSVDLLSISAHKIYGPKGVGALYVRKGVDLEALFPGGGQERGRRGGTENVAGIAGFGEAARLLRDEDSGSRERIEGIRDRFEAEVLALWEGSRVWGAKSSRLPNTSAIMLPGISGESLLIALDLAGIEVSVGSACSSGTTNPSPSILALGATAEEARSTLRFSFGNGNREQEIPRVIEVLAESRLRVHA